ncbi:MAG: DNA mismatch repair endonuclease MutL [Sedimentisphaerales bacterium]|nr:DNA mismatch repair endonuclease MutL [Sedimentisphaerales bacterium]
MGRITVLDDNMVNMIAAGEVIERPASVVKELLENSIDSGARRISVEIEDGGKKLISITDNGCGMDAGDLQKAFEPHATSKIKNANDLRSITTLGFRGEALASIASVAAVKAISRTRTEDGGQKTDGGANCIEIDCGDKGSISPASSDYGTTIQVRDLFYKLPARRKFLRTTNTELNHITEQFTRIALANRELDLSLFHNGREIYKLSGSDNLRQRIAVLFSEDIAESLLQTESREKGIDIFALLGRPEISRTNNKLQYIFLNGRFIRDKFISHAVREAYRTFIESERFGVVFLFLKMPYEDYDVNVHPTKIEVRFYNANLVHSQVLAVLREKLLGSDLGIIAKAPSTKPPVGLQSEDSQQSQKIRQAMSEFFKEHQQSRPQEHFSFTPVKSATVLASKNIPRTESLHPQQSPYTQPKTFIQIQDSYIVNQSDDGFEVIDQHALHERILYNQIKSRITSTNLQSQKLLLPESFQVTPTQQQAFENHRRIFEKLGLDIVSFGPKTLAVQAFPSLLSKANPVDFTRDLLDLLAEKGKRLDAETLLDEVIDMAACKAAIKAGQRLNDTEIQQLLDDRRCCELSSRCAHGRPTILKFTIAELEKQFKRT